MPLQRFILFCNLLLATAPLCSAENLQNGTAGAPSSSWTGFYAGAFVGGSFGTARATPPFDAGTGYYYNWTDNAYFADVDGFFGGAALGANWQSGRLVFGLEGETGYLQLKGSAADPNYQPGTTPLGDTITRTASDFFAAAYGRFGVAAGSFLIYGKAGGAILKAEAATIDPCSGSSGCGTTTLAMSGSKASPGWSAGGGLEWRVRKRWSVKAEYVYFNFGSLRTSGSGSVAGEYYRQSIDITAHAIKLGLQYRFNP